MSGWIWEEEKARQKGDIMMENEKKQKSEFIKKWEELRNKLIDTVPMGEAVNKIIEFIDKEVMQKIDTN